MLLAIDIGNTNIVIGLFQGKSLIENWRLRTVKERTSDECVILLRDVFQFSSAPVSEVQDVIIACVVPSVLPVMVEAGMKCFGLKPMVLGPGLKSGMPIYYDSPKDVGADRIANAVGAFEKYGQSLIVVDFGTATTFDYISPQGEYRGGVIAPGIGISLEALSRRAAKLPKIELQKPRTVVGKNTVGSMQSGIIYGYVGLVDGIVERIKAEVRTNPKVIATGGLASLVVSESKTIEAVEEFLTLEGLRIIFERNKAAP